MTRGLPGAAGLALAVVLTTPAAVSLAAPDGQRPTTEHRSSQAARGLATPARGGAPPGPTGADYAERELAARSLEAFEGGGAGLYIGGSTAAIVLLVLLLVLVL